MAEGLGFDGVQEGDELPVRSIFLSKDQVRAYARAAGQWSPRFTDDAGARREGLPGMITPGNMSMGLLELAPPIDTLERATGEALFHRSPKQQWVARAGDATFRWRWAAWCRLESRLQ